MSFRNSRSALRILIGLALLLSLTSSVVAAQADPVYAILNRINALRVQNGLLPLALNGTLSTAAQRHSDDMAATGNIDHTGSDGSTSLVRIQAAGYGHWNSYSRYGENIYGGQSATVAIAWEFWINSSPHLKNLLNTHYREVGIGVGHGSNGGTYFTLNFGAQPNVIPFFITSQNLSLVESTHLTLILHNEDEAPSGEGGSSMGRATQVRIAEGDDTSGATWQPWAASIDFQISDSIGLHTITIEYRDAQDRTAKYVRTVTLNSIGDSTATPIDTQAPTDVPTLEPTRAPVKTIAPTATSTPLPTATNQPTATPAPTDTPAPTNTPAPAATSTNEPTQTPRPSPSKTPAPSIMPTSPGPGSASVDRPINIDLANMPAWLLPLIGGLQALVIVAGAIAIFKRLK